MNIIYFYCYNTSNIDIPNKCTELNNKLIKLLQENFNVIMVDDSVIIDYTKSNIHVILPIDFDNINQLTNIISKKNKQFIFVFNIFNFYLDLFLIYKKYSLHHNLKLSMDEHEIIKNIKNLEI